MVTSPNRPRRHPGEQPIENSHLVGRRPHPSTSSHSRGHHRYLESTSRRRPGDPCGAARNHDSLLAWWHRSCCHQTTNRAGTRPTIAHVGIRRIPFAAQARGRGYAFPARAGAEVGAGRVTTPALMRYATRRQCGWTTPVRCATRTIAGGRSVAAMRRRTM